MDPNLFHIDWDRLLEVLVAIVVLSFFVERALALLFESKFFINRFKGKSLKELIAFIVGAGICIVWELDAISIVFLKENVTLFGEIVTGAVVAGGSKASIALFKDVMGVMSEAEKLKKEKSAAEKEKTKQKNDKN